MTAKESKLVSSDIHDFFFDQFNYTIQVLIEISCENFSWLAIFYCTYCSLFHFKFVLNAKYIWLCRLNDMFE